MREADQRIQELYTQYKLQTEPQGRRYPPIIDGITRRLRMQRNNRDEEKRLGAEQTAYQIVDLLRDQPGRYPLTKLRYISGPTGSGFDYGFDYPLGNHVFEINYWSYNRWGILVQKHPNDYAPEIEIVSGTVRADENPELDSYAVIEKFFHLPEGFRIPVGPLHFESDSVPMSEKELATDKAQAIAIAKAASRKVNKETLKMADRFFTPARKYPDRYFYWQPVLPENPSNIAIDFYGIKPYHMGLTLENAPTFNNTVITSDGDS